MNFAIIKPGNIWFDIQQRGAVEGVEILNVQYVFLDALELEQRDLGREAAAEG